MFPLIPFRGQKHFNEASLIYQIFWSTSQWGQKTDKKHLILPLLCLTQKHIRLKTKEKSNVLEANQSTKGLGCQNSREREVTFERRRKDFGRTRVMDHSDLRVLENVTQFTKMKSDQLGRKNFGDHSGARTSRKASPPSPVMNLKCVRSGRQREDFYRQHTHYLPCLLIQVHFNAVFT